MEFINRFFKPPSESFFLFGPRGTGKSQWIQHHFPNALYIDLLKPQVFRHFSSRPERLGELVAGNPQQKRVVIDEVQKVPELLSSVHSLMEEKKSIQFILTGSSARKLKRSGVDLLAGRAIYYRLHPFMATELGRKFHFQRAMEYGLLPLVWFSKKPKAHLQTYQALYLKEEVQLEGLVRNIGNFARFLEVISFSHAAVLNINNVARECEVERKTVEGYVEILEDILLAYRIPVFTKRAKRQLAAHPKFYLFDAGVFRSLRPQGPLDRLEEIEGAALEGLIVQHLRAWNDYRGSRNQLFYWRTRSQVEVDLILYGSDGLFAFEIKNTDRIRPEDLRSLHSFQADYPVAKLFFLYRGKERLLKKNILCLPCENFLRALDPKKGILSGAKEDSAKGEGTLEGDPHSP